MERLSRLRASKLFGHLNQSIALAKDGITILHGANGSGKTTLLKSLSEISRGDWSAVYQRPLTKLSLVFESGNKFEFDKTIEQNAGVFAYDEKKQSKRWQITQKEFEIFSDIRSSHIAHSQGTVSRKRSHQLMLDSQVWTEDSSGWYSLANKDTWNYFRHMDVGLKVEAPPSWLLEFGKVFHCTLIEEQRLIRFEANAEKAPKFTRVVSEYSKKIVDTIDNVVRRYGEKTQQLERTFPMRLVDALALDPPDAQTLEQNFNEIEVYRTRLQSAGLIGTEASMRLDEAALESLEVRRLLGVYAKDIYEKLALFNDIYNKISLFENLITDYFSRKTIKISRNGIEITTNSGQRLDVTALSSGEQHIFVLFFRLIFVEPSAQHLVLIDEPELSLHPKWQIRFVDDLERIREVSQLDFVLASHSPLIFQGHSELGRDLEA